MQATVFSPLTFNFFSSYNYDNDLDDLFLIRGLLLVIAQLLFLPIFGWLADVHYGRYKVLNTGIWIMWVCSVAGVVAMIVQYLFPETSYVIHYIINLLYFIAYSGCAAFMVTGVPFGTDQILDGSADETSAFVFWCISTYSAGGWFAYALYTSVFDCGGLNHTTITITMFMFLFSVVLLSLALCCDFLCRDWLVIEPKSCNPLKTVLTVVKYAASHRHPARRSALTYWEEKIPSRIDLGKSKYGGPFTTEEVEDVKTFFRILAVAVCINITIGVVGAGSSFTVLNHVSHFRLPSSAHHSRCLISFITAGYNWMLVATLSIVLYEFVVYPFARKWIPSILPRAGIAAASQIILEILLLILESVGHAQERVRCMFTAENVDVLNISYLWVYVPSTMLSGLQYAVFFTTVTEFIVAQSPYGMKGLLIGSTWSLSVISFAIGTALNTAWTYGWKSPFSSPSCGTYYYLFVTLLSVAGLVVYIAVARWYKRRERDEPENQQAMVEEVYNRYVQQENVLVESSFIES